MATEFKPSVLVSDVFGSAGDVTAVHRDGKTFLRKRRSGEVVLTPAQVAHLEVHRRALAAWRTVPQSVQEIWHEYAREAEPHQPPFDHSSWISGQNLFVSAYHGFHTLGVEHVPEPCRFESFPPFSVSAMSASVEDGVLVLRLLVAGLEFVEVSRYWLYGRLQLTELGKGISSMLSKKSVLASGPCSVSPVSLVVKDWRELWPAVEGLSVIQVHGSFVLLDAMTGYRSQRRRLLGVVSLNVKKL